MKTNSLCDCGQYPIYPGSDECRVCDGSYRLTEDERKRAIYKLSKPKAVALAIMCAEGVLPLWRGDDRPAKAIQAAKNWLNKPTERNCKAAMRIGNYHPHPALSAAAYAAYAAARTAGADAYGSGYYSTYVVLCAADAMYAGTNTYFEKVDRWLYEN